MAKYKVVLHGRNVLMSDEETGQTQRAGFHVICCVDAVDTESAGTTALDILKRHPRYVSFASWPAGSAGRPEIEVEAVDAIPRLSRRVAPGITAGFTFYVDKGEETH